MNPMPIGRSVASDQALVENVAGGNLEALGVLFDRYEPALRRFLERLAVRPGDVAQPGQAVARVLRADDLWVKVFVPATDLGKLRPDQAVEVEVDSHPGRRFPGRVTHVASVSEFTPRNVQSADERKYQMFAAKVRVADPDGVFKSGMAAGVFVTLGE